jgi:hypothetical protein
MTDWKAELDALVEEMMAFAKTVNSSISEPRPLPRETVERIGLNPLDLGGPEREEIKKRVKSFKAHQQRFIKEREDYAAAILLKMRFSSRLLEVHKHSVAGFLGFRDSLER